ncbi:hypothetical protein [Streptomyces canus]|uniref:hypothetical protein n=1 Tax=Streptomyces canus TaxID=58343 RepID=UPI0036EBE301
MPLTGLAGSSHPVGEHTLVSLRGQVFGFGEATATTPPADPKPAAGATADR